MFDVEPSSTAPTADAPPPQCAPPPADAVALLNAAEVRVQAGDGDGGEGGAGGSVEGGAEGGQKVTPWEVEVSLREGRGV